MLHCACRSFRELGRQGIVGTGTMISVPILCYAVLFHGGITMSNSDLLPSLLYKINQNQLALEAAIMELTLWVEQRGSAEVAGNVRGALDTISRNEEFINMTLAVLMTPE
jgi:hypothetical protein